MQNPRAVLENLDKQATKHANNPDYKFKELYKQFNNPEWYIHAYAQLYANKGSGTKGVDGETMDGFGEEQIQRIIEVIKDESYQPKPSKRTYIPKKNGKKRPIGIPTMTDRYVQEIARELLTTIYEPTFSPKSFGFRQGMNCHQAIDTVCRRFRGTVWFIEGDIKSFFDNIDHHVMIGILRRKIDDERFIRLIWKFLRAGYVEDWVFNKTYSGTPQGGIISPILANIYLNELDKFVEKLQSQFDIGESTSPQHTPEWKTLERKLHAMVKKAAKAKEAGNQEQFMELVKERKRILHERGQIPSYSIVERKKFRKMCYVRYADDFLIGIIGSKEDAVAIKNQLKQFLAEELKLELSEEKTLITHSSKPARFLSYEFSVERKGWKKKMRRINGLVTAGVVARGLIRVKMPKDIVIKKMIELDVIKDLNAEQWRGKSCTRLIGNSDLEIMKIFNAQIRGLYNYFRIAENVAYELNIFYGIMKFSFFHTLAAKHKSTIAKQLRKLRWKDTAEFAIIPKDDNGNEGEPVFFYHKGFARNKEVSMKRTMRQGANIDATPNIYKYMGRNELEKRMLANECEWCHTKIKCHVHHVNAMKNIKKDKGPVHVQMAARNRKTMNLCPSCHDKLHRGEL